jgi:Zn-finger nucleic acid-binding protein
MTKNPFTKPSHPEDEYFVREDAEKKRRIALEMKRSLAEEQRRALQELHQGHCPKCGMKMQAIQYGKLEVDACFACGGVFLEKHEIDVIAAPQQKGIMAAILNWFSDETKHPVK